MIKIKHLMDGTEKADGERLWIEPIGLCKDMQKWCKVDHVLPHLGPPRELWEWYEEHPDGYECFRAKYHEALQKGPYMKALQAMAQAAQRETFTLVHQGDSDKENTGTALYEFLSELSSYCPPDEKE